ncbi:MAG: histone deacetylase [Planctomycetota bacterium]
MPTPSSIAGFTSERYFVQLPPGHVFPMEKFPQSARALVEDGTLARDRIIDPGQVDERDLLRVHTPAYVESIRTGRFNELTAKKLGLPPSEALSVRSHNAVAGTIAAARFAMAEGIACNLAGGTHHAFPDSGQGFCVFNDVAVAIRTLQHEEPLLHAFVADLDAHQGNGTHAIFADDPYTFTYSLHVGRNYPSAKVPGDLDVPLDRWASAEAYFEAMEQTLPSAIERFEPDIVFYIAGVDPHAEDRFGQMKLSTDDLGHRDERVIAVCRDWQIPTVVLYGGGYHRTPGMTAQLHAQTVRIAAERWRRERRG